jgi:hypothetical protein
MKKLIIFFLFFLSLAFVAISQDSVMYSRDFRLYEGIYNSYQELRFNWPIDKDKIITALPKNQLDFYTKLTDQEIIEYQERDGSIEKIRTSKIWGYCQNNVVFIQQENDFFRIPVFGAISNFIGTAEVVNYSPGFDPFMNAPLNSSAHKTKEIRQFLFDFYSGEVAEFSIEKVTEYLKRDEHLYSEYIALNKRKKKELAFKYIRLYNEKHPIYFPKG